MNSWWISTLALGFLIADGYQLTSQLLLEKAGQQLNAVESLDVDDALDANLTDMPAQSQNGASVEDLDVNGTLDVNPALDVEDAMNVQVSLSSSQEAVEPPTVGKIVARLLQDDDMTVLSQQPPESLADGFALFADGFDVMFALLWLSGMTCLPGIIAKMQGHSITTIHRVQMSVVALWLISSIILCTQLCEFNSAHFSGTRHLTVVEIMYFLSQIVTTVGYGDYTPANGASKCFVAFQIIVSILIVADILSEAVSIVTARVQARHDQNSHRPKTTNAWIDVGYACIAHVVITLTWATVMCFDSVSFGDGLYASVVTFSTVGFGAITPATRSAQTFASFWFIIGGGSLANLMASFGSLQQAYRFDQQQATK